MKMNLKRIALMLICICATFNAFAQKQSEGKPSVFVDYFYHPSNVPESWIEALRNKVLEGLQETQRVIITDVDSEAALKLEKSRREEGELSAGGDANRLSTMSKLGANYLIQGVVTSFSTEYKKSSSGDSHWYTASVNYTIKVINPKDGTTIASENFKHGNTITEMSTGNTEDEAAVDITKFARKDMRELVNEAFKLNGTIIEINESKGDEAKQVYISLGSSHGVTPKGSFKVFVLRTVAGRASRKEIGELKVNAIEGEDLTLCDVKKGGKEIKEAMEAKQTIEVEVFHKASLGSKLKKGIGSVM